jgi:hypothetical protein
MNPNLLSRAAILLTSLFALASLPAATPPFELRDGDRVLFIGDTFFEREVDYGHIETRLTAAFPDRNVIRPWKPLRLDAVFVAWATCRPSSAAASGAVSHQKRTSCLVRSFHHARRRQAACAERCQAIALQNGPPAGLRCFISRLARRAPARFTLATNYQHCCS